MTENLKVLLVDDDEEEFFLLKELMSRYTGGAKVFRFELDWVSTYEEAVTAMQNCGYDAFLVDYRLGARSGLDLLREAAAVHCLAPIIILTGQGSYEADLSAMELGAADYLEKGQISPPLLERSIRYAIERKQAEAQLKKQAAELEALQKATSSLLQTLDLSELVGQILDAACKAIPAAERCMLHVVSQRHGRKNRLTQFSLDDPRIKQVVLPDQILGAFQDIIEGHPLLIDDLKMEPVLLSQLRDEEKRHNVRSAIIVPLKFDREFLGTISLSAPRPAVFSEADLNLLNSFAATATAALQNAILHAEAQNLAATDPLTGLFNRRTFFELGQREIERSQCFGRPLSWIMFDVDLFKGVNDRYGHTTGDQVLKEIAVRCQEVIRDVDVFARYGGDEFVMLLPETDREQAGAVAERIRTSIGDRTVDTDAGPIHISISVGITQATPEFDDLGLLLNRVDQALYRSKRAGRNRITVLG